MGTDARCKFVEMLDSGRFRIGSDGSSNVGYVPPAGCRVRVPNIIWMNATAASRAINAVPNATFTTRYDFITTSGGSINCDKVMGNFYLSFSTAYSISLKMSTIWMLRLLQNVAQRLSLRMSYKVVIRTATLHQ